MFIKLIQNLELPLSKSKYEDWLVFMEKLRIILVVFKMALRWPTCIKESLRIRIRTNCEGDYHWDKTIHSLNLATGEIIITLI